MASPSHPQRRLLKAILGIALALIAFEVLLQLLALGVWLSGWHPAAATAPGDRTILCVGDSFTYGMGASDREMSYPSQLQRRLEQMGVDAHVVNVGWPGQNSREVILRLESQLRTHRPELVYLLFGTNDHAERLERFDLGEEGRAATGGNPFVWRFRLLHMASWFRQWVRGGPTYQRDLQLRDRLIGDWSRDDAEVRFEANGRVTWLRQAAWWQLEEDHIVIRELSGSLAIRAAVELDGDRLALTVAGGAPLVLQRGRRPDPLDAARRAARESNHTAAIAAFREHLDSPTSARAIAAHAGLAMSAFALGDADVTRHEARWLSARALAGEAEAAQPAVHTLLLLDERARAQELMRELGARGNQVHLLPILMDIAASPGEHRVAWEWMAELIEDESVPDVIRTNLMRMHAAAIRDDEPVAAMKLLLRAELRDSLPELVARMVTDRAFDGDVIEQALTQMELTDAQRAHLRSIVDPSVGSPAYLESTAHHLRVAHELCRRHGARLTLLNYPIHVRGLNATMSTLAAELGVDLIEVTTRFEQLRDTVAWSELFNVDCHCNDRGYGVMAGLVAEHAMALLR